MPCIYSMEFPFLPSPQVRHYTRAAFHSHREVEQFIVEQCWYFGFGVHPKSTSAFDKCWTSYCQVLFSEDIDTVVNRVVLAPSPPNIPVLPTTFKIGQSFRQGITAFSNQSL